MEILSFKNVSFTYPLSEKKALDNISFSIKRGELAVICGESGSGKSTLLRLIKRELIPNGGMDGKITCFGKDIFSLDEKESAFKIGYVSQNPEYQTVTDKVYHELAFGLEGMGLSNNEIRARVAETASYFGLDAIFEKNVSELSGGQKQLLCLASVMATRPEILLLDEPTSRLDPIASLEFINTVKRLNRELSLTVIIAEHRLDELLPRADRLMAVSDGGLFAKGNTRDTVLKLKENEMLLSSLPASVRLFAKLGINTPCPLTVSEGRVMIETGFKNEVPSLSIEKHEPKTETALCLSEVFFRYRKDSPDVLKGLSLDIKQGEIFSIIGGNGSGKSTALSVMSGILKPYYGKISVFGKPISKYKDGALYKNCLSMLPQDVTLIFSKDTVREELGGDAFPPFGLEKHLSKHPFDLSGGEKQLLGIAMAMKSKPRLLLLDEPTKGLDSHTEKSIIRAIKELKKQGVTVVAVTHDLEFASEISDRCAMLFNGEAVSVGTPREMFSQNAFYTTAVSRMTKGYYENAVTVDDAVKLCLANERRQK